MKVANSHQHVSSYEDGLYRSHSITDVLNFFKWRSRTRAVAPEKLSSGSLVADDEGSPDGEPKKAADEHPSMSESDGGEFDHPSLRFATTNGERTLSNGDFYAGSWQGNLPEGTGKYLWSDGCMYEGEWGNGIKTGRGRISWPSGATYEGELLCGNLHGRGVYTGVDDTTYKGSWRMNLKHGEGVKSYANGDVYEGFWKAGLQHGDGRYIWQNGNQYVGEWRKGVMNGKGVLRWSNGDTYNGQWLDGLEHGHGVYTWTDGACYMGTWRKGVKDGTGIFYPTGYFPPRSRRSFEAPAASELSGSDCPASPMERRWSLEGGLDLTHSKESSQKKSAIDTPVLEREYVQGVLINEIVKQGDAASLKVSKRRQRRPAKRPGETVIKGHGSYDLMLNLQLGIRTNVGKMTLDTAPDVCPQDFGPRSVFVLKFPRLGSHLTPPHQSLDFKWRDYCPNVFRSLRKMFRIDSADYMMSLCGNDALREISSPGKSGSVFYLSQDDKFMIKTMRKAEVKVLLEMLPSYYEHVQSSSNTLITKFFGLHQVEPQGGRKVRFVVMGNVFCTDLHIHRRFDLKGSSQGRSTDKVEIDENTTLKDLDLNFVFHLEASWRQCLLKQIEQDCKFLESQRIMDYSLLLGVHFRAPQCPAVFSPVPSLPPDAAAECTDGLDSSKRSGTLATTEDLCSLPKTTRLQIRLGVNMPARADRSHCDDGTSSDVYDVVLYLGIIDILQQYDITKRVEHAYKSLQFDSQSISAVDPRLYSNRFQELVRRIFPSNDTSVVPK
ncbi:phosphatidylinositol 4-phosphate 5-kinase 9 [Selaginella moellendorffii]|uniref:phosphatidylinositol 4-phosphate 5-kinase 9 n=1 Tax=Selaginella moellendorffii TaxID=88036 RepID=UPI000D1C8EAE|nr:phosphatidylinositol 4-phosphate 5-kinase 9 [Selaginella moellendorffii]|eukprot:XP_024516069.1 phosphatidylinositol 4-phosphate 5-kinase 9 [Selaginella moellendorffii]